MKLFTIRKFVFLVLLALQDALGSFPSRSMIRKSYTFT